MAVDGQGNVYVTGNSRGSGNGCNYATIKYSPDGKLLWGRRYNGPGNGSDYASAMAVDGQGNIYVTGRSDVPGAGTYCLTIKYSPDGRRLWVRRYKGPEHNHGSRALAVDALGNVYIIGIEGYNDTPNSVTVKYSPDGRRLWVRRYYSPKGFYSPDSLAVDGQGNVYVNGLEGIYYSEAYSGTIKYSPDGQQLWARCDILGCFPRAMAVDPAGQVHVIGSYQLIKYSPDGQLLWSKDFTDRFLVAMTLDGQGNVYVTGGSWDLESDYDCITSKHSSEGEEMWARRYNGPGNGNDIAAAIAVDGQGNVYVAGSEWSGSGNDYVTIRYIQSPRTGP
jgi:hypothetical protein